MKKIMLTMCLMAGAIFAHAQTAAPYESVGMKSSYNSNYGWEQRYTFQTSGSYGIGLRTSYPKENVVAFGYYYLSNPSKLIAGNVESGYLGSFNAGDAIGLWFEIKAEKNGKTVEGFFSTTDVGQKTIFGISSYSGDEGAFAWAGINSAIGYVASYYFTNTAAPVGEPLPGVMAALAVGGCAFLIGRKLKNRAK